MMQSTDPIRAPSEAPRMQGTLPCIALFNDLGSMAGTHDAKNIASQCLKKIKVPLKAIRIQISTSTTASHITKKCFESTGSCEHRVYEKMRVHQPQNRGSHK
eukprot:gnl/TRDRNA2_/TRDRNA2_150819_c0_seq2.p1 gnl/TRDRNA2_/TRDRNA2_150819_c0~~gnl/TRDRNA2_/TRDRNA2_150819_c0_seq2.p1  ORF type:complete len:102 (-),score=7.74 gnl/TRDRNA2_/TRDRNA2_150819_c0_seq2:35-340(-)